MEHSTASAAKKYPKALYFCGSVLSFTNFSYYGMKLVLLLFIAESVSKGGLGLSNAEATSLLASLMAFSYLSPIVGGWISDRFLGPKLCVILGMIVSGCGYYLAFSAHSKTAIQMTIALCVVGSGLYKSTSQTLIGSLFEDDDPRKDGAFSMAYTFTNIGVLLGPFLCGLVANQWFAQKEGGEIVMYGYRMVFLVAALVIWAGAAFFAIGQKFFLKNFSLSATAKENLKEKKEMAKIPLTSAEKRRMWVILILAFFTIFFWIAYNQASMSIALYMQEFIDLKIGSFQIPTAWIDSYNGLLCVILGPIMAAIWLKLSKTKHGDLNISQKMSLGFVFLAAAFLFMIVSVMKTGEVPGEGAKASVLFVIAFITFQSIGEMCFAPVGYGMVNKLAPAKYSSLLMGVWFASMFVANKLSGYVEMIIEQLGMLQVFIIIPVCLLVIGFLLFALNKTLDRMAGNQR
ncbi:peptide MFS transporter [Sellimonas caecigallum]|uniref:Peptide MFS transporter n=1 Tax=Sellimonas caecigallum TaxID=2592333 RepID=A0ABS7L8S7_9FIRM|nr:peptide MFS transporter [Sellimonas caecigallum]MBY0759501.1 peptide MFS transporter [Sellimonas caecigallum]